jgi:hypothetical protein
MLRVRADFAARVYVAVRARSDMGCTLFVKLRQFLPDDLEPAVVDTSVLDSRGPNGAIKVHVLHRHCAEEVAVVDGSTDARYEFSPVSVPRELFVLSGEVDVDGLRMTRLDWLRVPAADSMKLRFATVGRVFVKARAVDT